MNPASLITVLAFIVATACYAETDPYAAARKDASAVLTASIAFGANLTEELASYEERMELAKTDEERLTLTQDFCKAGIKEFTDLSKAADPFVKNFGARKNASLTAIMNRRIDYNIRIEESNQRKRDFLSLSESVIELLDTAKARYQVVLIPKMELSHTLNKRIKAKEAAKK